MKDTSIFLFLLYAYLGFSVLQLFYLKSIIRYRIYTVIIFIFCLIFFNDHPYLIIHGIIIGISLIILFLVSFNKKFTERP